MPFRPITIDVTYGKPELLVKAAAGDVEVQVSCVMYSSGGTAAGPNYLVGVKADDGTVAGKCVTANEFTSDLSEGDELWVAAAEQLAFSTTIRITGLVRSVSQAAAYGDAGHQPVPGS
jgi:hypothetical protein